MEFSDRLRRGLTFIFRKRYFGCTTAYGLKFGASAYSGNKSGTEVCSVETVEISENNCGKTLIEVADHRRAEALPRTIVLRDPTSFGEAQKPTKAVAGPCTSYQLGFDEHLTNAGTPIARERGFPADEV
jgi:hypothetical protein